MIPLWYTLCCMAATGLAGYLCAQLWPIVSAIHLARLRKRALRQVAELRRLMAWTPPAVHWEAGLREDRWSLPISPRLTDRDRIDAAKAAALELSAHAAPAPEPNWHRGEHRIYSPGWFVEVAARLLSVGAKPNGVQTAHEPKHAAWNVDTQALQVFVAEATAEESVRRDREMDAMLLANVARLAGAR